MIPSLTLKINHNTVEIDHTQVPSISDTSASLINEFNKLSSSFSAFDELNSTRKAFESNVSFLSNDIRYLKNAKDQRTQDLIIGLLRGAFYVAIVAATALSFIALQTPGTLIPYLPLAILGIFSSILCAFWNVGEPCEAAVMLAPFAPLYFAYRKVPNLEADVKKKTDKCNEHIKRLNELMQQIDEFFADTENTDKIKQELKARIHEIDSAIQILNTQLPERKILEDKNVKYREALEEFEKAFAFFHSLHETN